MCGREVKHVGMEVGKVAMEAFGMLVAMAVNYAHPPFPTMTKPNSWRMQRVIDTSPMCLYFFYHFMLLSYHFYIFLVIIYIIII